MPLYIHWQTPGIWVLMSPANQGYLCLMWVVLIGTRKNVTRLLLEVIWDSQCQHKAGWNIDQIDVQLVNRKNKAASRI